MNLADIRREYSGHELDLSNVLTDPVAQFSEWMKEAIAASVHEPTAMTLATADPEGQPLTRVVLLKGIEDRRFVFYTNYNSQKGRHLALNPKACLNFFWPELERQVIIQGLVHKVAETESDAYFNSRPRGSQIGAWASEQSRPLESREELAEKASQYAASFEGADVPRPEHWGGYALRPFYIEFWQGRESRLHDRIVYRLDEGLWRISRLSP